MKKQFSLYKDWESFGTAEVEREGLYFQIRIRCSGPARISVSGSAGERDLGICVPSEDGSFGMVTRIPIKQIGPDNICFQLEQKKKGFYLVVPGEPFLHLEKIRNSILACDNEKIGIQTEISSPTGQWSDPKISE